MCCQATSPWVSFCLAIVCVCVFFKKGSALRQACNRRGHQCFPQAHCTLYAESAPARKVVTFYHRYVGRLGLKTTTFRSSCLRSNQLSYRRLYLCVCVNDGVRGHMPSGSQTFGAYFLLHGRVVAAVLPREFPFFPSAGLNIYRHVLVQFKAWDSLDVRHDSRPDDARGGEISVIVLLKRCRKSSRTSRLLCTSWFRFSVPREFPWKWPKLNQQTRRVDSWRFCFVDAWKGMQLLVSNVSLTAKSGGYGGGLLVTWLPRFGSSKEGSLGWAGSWAYFFFYFAVIFCSGWLPSRFFLSLSRFSPFLSLTWSILLSLSLSLAFFLSLFLLSLSLSLDLYCFLSLLIFLAFFLFLSSLPVYWWIGLINA